MEVHVLLYPNYPGGVDVAGVVTSYEVAQRWRERSSSNNWRRMVVDDPEMLRLLSIATLPESKPE